MDIIIQNKFNISGFESNITVIPMSGASSIKIPPNGTYTLTPGNSIVAVPEPLPRTQYPKGNGVKYRFAFNSCISFMKLNPKFPNPTSIITHPPNKIKLLKIIGDRPPTWAVLILNPSSGTITRASDNVEIGDDRQVHV